MTCTVTRAKGLARALVALTAIVVAPCLAGPGRALADDETPEQRARALNERGLDLLGRSDFVGALEAFRAAQALYPNPAILLNMGTALRNLGRIAEAADTYDAYAADPRAPEERRGEVRAIVAELSSHLARVRVVASPNARLTVDGRTVEPDASDAPRAIRVEPGSHTLTAQREGGSLRAATVVVAAGDERTLDLREVRAQTSPARARRSRPHGPRHRTSPLRVAAVVSAAVAVAGAATGAILGLVAMSRWDEAKSRCPGGLCADERDLALPDETRRLATASTVVFAISGAAIAAAVIFWIVPAPAEPRERASIVLEPSVGAASAGVRVRGAL